MYCKCTQYSDASAALLFMRLLIHWTRDLWTARARARVCIETAARLYDDRLWRVCGFCVPGIQLAG